MLSLKYEALFSANDTFILVIILQFFEKTLPYSAITCIRCWSMQYFTTRAWTRTRNLRKSEHWTFRKSGPYTKIQGCWFQIWQYCNKFLAQKYHNKTFLVPNCGIFIVLRNVSLRQIWEGWFQILQYYFQIPAPKKTQIRHFWSEI